MTATTAPPVLASDRQHDFLRSLARQRALYGPTVGPDRTVELVEAEIASGMTRDEASSRINHALSSPQHPTVATAAIRTAASVTPGQRAYLCDLARGKAVYGTTVDPDQTLARIEAEIDAGMTKDEASSLIDRARRAKPHPTAASPVPIHTIDGVDGLTVPQGCYAVLLDAGLRFYRIYVPATGEHEGVEVIRRYASENLLALYPDEAAVALRLIDADPDAAAYRFSDEHTRCFRCGKLLTDAVSRMLSVGPTCRGFASHKGLRAAAEDVDRDPTRRAVYRAVRGWALGAGFDDQPLREGSVHGDVMPASRVAAAWSSLPGILALGADRAVETIRAALLDDAEIPAPIVAMLNDAAGDTALDLIATGTLTGQLLQLLIEHPNRRVRLAATAVLADALSVV